MLVATVGTWGVTTVHFFLTSQLGGFITGFIVSLMESHSSMNLFSDSAFWHMPQDFKKLEEECGREVIWLQRQDITASFDYFIGVHCDIARCPWNEFFSCRDILSSLAFQLFSISVCFTQPIYDSIYRKSLLNTKLSRFGIYCCLLASAQHNHPPPITRILAHKGNGQWGPMWTEENGSSRIQLKKTREIKYWVGEEGGGETEIAAN
jgi:hypothetical protein